MSEWKKVKFCSLFAIPSKNGLTKPSRVRGKGNKMINMGELFANGRIYDIPMDLVPLNEAEKCKNQVLPDDLLFARQSLVLEGAGKCSIVMQTSEMTVFESHLIRIRLNKEEAYPLFYYYFFNSSYNPVKTIVSQCAQAGIRASDLSELQVIHPSLPTQHRIATILSRYDTLIENYQKQIKLLEEAAQRLYKEWFVDLRFPGYENVKMVDGLPEGWERKKLGEVCEVNKTSIEKNYAYNYVNYTDLGNVREGSIQEPVRYAYGQEPGRAKRVANDGDVIWGMVRPNLKSYALVQNPKPQDVYSTGFAILSSKAVPFSFLYCAVITDDFVGYLVNCTNGAAYPAVKAEHFENAVLLVPSRALLDEFSKFAEPIFRKCGKLSSQIRLLTEARDRLLPRLMGGEMEV